MAIYYAGEALLLEDLSADAKCWLDRFLQFEEANLFGCEPTACYDERNGPRSGVKEFVGLPTPNYPDPPPPKLNTLYWPTGAVRWARGVFLATESVKNAILETVVVRDTQILPAQLILSSNRIPGSTENGFLRQGEQWTLSTEMYLLPPRPVSEVDTLNPATQQLWLLPLVDARYYWQFLHVGDFSPASWSQSFEDLATALVADLSTSAIPAAYQTPCEDEINRPYANAAYMLDAIAHSVGHRIVRRLDLSVVSESFEDATDTLEANLDSRTFRPWGQSAGGAIVPARVGKENIPERSGLIPEKILVTFPNATGGGVGGTVEKSATDYGVKAYVPGLTKVFHDCMVYSESEADAVADQIATDYYGWKAHFYDRCFIGVKAWELCGFDDYVEWSVGRRKPDGNYEAQTRVQSLPYNFGVDEQLHGPGPVSSGGSGETKIITFEICEACCEECWADVSIISKAFTGEVPGAGDLERECYDGYYANIPKQLEDYEVRIYDIEGCYLNEPNENLIGRKGKAVYMTKEGLNCSGGVRPEEICGGYEIPSPRWEIMTLCCDEELCE